MKEDEEIRLREGGKRGRRREAYCWQQETGNILMRMATLVFSLSFPNTSIARHNFA